MNNSFTELYNSYSNIELLEIVKKPNNYQPDAVAAAESILKTRNISEQEYNSFETKVDDANSISSFIQPLFKNYNDSVFSSKPPIHSLGWLNLIPLLFILTIVSSIYGSIEKIPFCILHKNMLFLSFHIINVLAIIFIVYLYKNQSKWFWILLFGDRIFAVYANFKPFVKGVFYNIINFSSIKMFINDFISLNYLLDRSTNLYNIIISIAMIYYLYRNELKSYYKIEDNIIRKIILVVACIIIVSGIVEIISLISYYRAANSNMFFQF